MPDYSNIRNAKVSDLSRVAEIYVFNNRLSYFPIFNNIDFSFKQLQVISYAKELEKNSMDKVFVYDDGVIKGFILIDKKEVQKLYVDYFFRNQGIGGCLLEYSTKYHDADHLWTLEKNESAIAFYKKHGFECSSEKRILYGPNGVEEFLVKMCKNKGVMK